MKDIILLKMGEIVLKGLNRKYFEQKLISNAHRALSPFGDYNIYASQSIVYIEPKSESCDVDGAYSAALKLFGAISVSRAEACEKTMEAVVKTAASYLEKEMHAAKSFKVETKRADKRFPMTSVQISQYVGGELSEMFPDTAVDVHNPELCVNVELRETLAYVHAGGVRGAGGMPVGANGRAVSLLSGGIDSPVSTYLIARRGVHMIPLHFFSFPYTGEDAKNKVITLAKILSDYCLRMTLEIVPFTRIQEEIRKNCPEEFFTIIMRRFMTRIAERVASSNGCGALVTGENLGQVASQTMEAMAVTEECVTLPVLRPLVGMDKADIVAIARRIGTFETSILPYEDCCTLFTPRRPKIKPRLSEVLKAEEALEIEALESDAFSNIERIKIR